MLWGKTCPAFARWMTRSCAARRRASAPSQYGSYWAHEGGVCWIEGGRQKCGIEIPLDGSNATGALVKPLREGLFHRLAAAMTKLREFGAARGNFDQGAARACNGASQLCYQHPWGAKAHASSILFLPRLVGNRFEDAGVAHTHDFMDYAAMQALAMGCELAFFARLP